MKNCVTGCMPTGMGHANGILDQLGAHAAKWGLPRGSPPILGYKLSWSTACTDELRCALCPRTLNTLLRFSLRGDVAAVGGCSPVV